MLSACCLVLIGWIFPPTSLVQADPPNRVLDERTLKRSEPSVMWADLNARMRLVQPTGSPPLLRVTYPKGKWGSNDSGSQIMFELPPRESATCSYQIRFADDFQFVKGGKLPGLAGGTATSGKDRPTGDGWTARLMWRPGGNAVLYLYHLDQRKRYGDDFPLNVKFVPGKWHQIKQTVTVNQNDHSDGRIQIWVDGGMVLDQRGLRLRSGNQAPVDRFYFSTFFGGSGRQWAPNADQTIDFSAISVTETSKR